MTPFPHLVTGPQMAAVDAWTIAAGTSGVELMERAGARVVDSLQARFDGLQGLRVAVVCGKGNNGGDGLVVARRLVQAGVAVDTFLGAGPDGLGGDAAGLLRALEAAGGKVLPAAQITAASLGRADVVVDALLGTGLRGASRAAHAAVIEAINACGRPVVAVDLPSGVDASSGAVAGVAVRAAVTVTFGLAKVGHLFPPGRGHCGALELADIGFPDGAVSACGATTHLLTATGVAERLPWRATDAHKGTCGSVAVIAGSAGMSGAAALAAEAALRAGAGRVTLGAPASLHDVLETKLTEVMTRPLPEVRRRRCLARRAHGDAAVLAAGADALAIGPGLGRYRETVDLVRRLLARTDLPPTVIDADALYALGDGAGYLGPGRVITPHAGEFSRLTGRTVAAIRDEPLLAAREFAVRHGVVVVLKGGPTVVAAGDGRTFVNPTGNAGMATAGAGDVLTGVVAGFLAQGCTPLDAAVCAVYLHGLAGDRGRDEVGEWSLLAGDVLARLGAACIEVAAQGRPGAGFLDTRHMVE